MSIKDKKPMIKQSVGALYYVFNNSEKSGEFDPASYETEVVKSDVVKNIGTTENNESANVYASGKVYETVNDSTYIDMAVEIVAIDPADLAKMRGDSVKESGLILSGAPAKRPYFAFGKVVKKIGGKVRYEWFPKCQLIENTDDIGTKEENFSEQNDTITIRAYSFDKDENKKTAVDSEITAFPANLTEEKFFEKPILTDEDLTKATTDGT